MLVRDFELGNRSLGTVEQWTLQKARRVGPVSSRRSPGPFAPLLALHDSNGPCSTLAALAPYHTEQHKRPRHGKCRDGRENTVCPAPQRSTCMMFSR
ncbi:hypothetical protein M3J09_009712 [Ascochyta lentis]